MARARKLLWLAVKIGAGASLLASCGQADGNLAFAGHAGAVNQASANTSQNYKLLYVFKGKRDGAAPYGAMAYLNGELYGTTTAGGAHGNGTVFSVGRSGHEEVVYNFDYNDSRTDGFEPKASLVVYGAALYGTTTYGGKSDYGTVFRVTLGGNETVLYEFNGLDGAYPAGGVAILNGVVYGTTYAGGSARGGCGSGCGTVFKIDGSGNETVIHSFGGLNYSDGQYPTGDLISIGGTLYGTTSEGGRSNLGTVFSMTTSGTETVVHAFGSGTDGAYAYSGVIAVKGGLFGTTQLGGTNGYGIAYGLTSSGLEYRYSFGTKSPGVYPYAGLTRAGRYFYGTTSAGGDPNAGTIFRVTL